MTGMERIKRRSGIKNKCSNRTRGYHSNETKRRKKIFKIKRRKLKMYTNQESRLYAEQKEKEIKAGMRFSEKEDRSKLKEWNEK